MVVTTERPAEARPELEEQPPPAPEVPEQKPPDEVIEDAGARRAALASLLSTLGAAVMAGGIFEGPSPRFYAAVAGALGVGLAYFARRIRSPLYGNIVIAFGVFLVGVLMLLPLGIGAIANFARLVSEAAEAGDILSPPAPFSPGWRAILGWIMATVGFGAGWMALEVRRPSIGVILPLPVAAIAAISIPDAEQIPSGIALLVLFAAALGVISGIQSIGEEGENRPLNYELRRAVRSLPVIAIISAAAFLLARFDFLFPDTVFDPTQEPQKPKTVPLSEVVDRVLFQVESTVSGPWRMGSLDVYDGTDWRLPPFADSRLREVPRSGIVDSELRAEVRAKFTVVDLGGAVLPGLPNIGAIVGEVGARNLSYDLRNGNIRFTQGQIPAGLVYNVTAPGLPSVEQLKAITVPPPRSIREFAQIKVEPPSQTKALIAQAKSQFNNKWEQFDFLRTTLLQTVTASGQGIPVPVRPEKVEDMLFGSKEGSPFEIVAGQGILARWVGVPSRIAYGFDGGDEISEGVLEVRPKHGATFVEVYFPGYKWLPIIGTPLKAKANLGGENEDQIQDPNVLPSDDIAVPIFLPAVVPPESLFYAQLRRNVLIALPLIILIGLAYLIYPGIRKMLRRSRRRALAASGGPRARVAFAYTEWRDLVTDYGYQHTGDTPFVFLRRFLPDREHAELSWLVTRALWGDLQHEITEEMASDAEELSRTLSRRLAQGHPITLRIIAAFSKLSLRNPWEIDERLVIQKKERHAQKVA